MEFTARFSREEDENEELEDASRREIPFMTAAASSVSSSAASASASEPGSASGSAPPFRSADGAGPSGSGVGGGGDVQMVEKEHMFDKVVTPSDVGKLNRLVIPKQYAEKYFPLDAAANEKGLLLNFEDRAGKSWRFRYSYWNSSQSYVMTKGWSRFVKEKRLDAGDTVSFSRGVGEPARHRFFIDWKRRVATRDPLRMPRLPLPMPHYGPWGPGVVAGGRGFFIPPSSPPATLYEHRLRQGLDFRNRSMNPAMGSQLLFWGSDRMLPPLLPRAPSPVHYTVQHSGATAGSAVVLDSVPAVIESPTTATKRVRLFGVNLDNPHSGEGSSGSSNQGNAVSSQIPAWRQRDPTLRLLELPSQGADSSAASTPSSSSSSKRELDLDL